MHCVDDYDDCDSTVLVLLGVDEALVWCETPPKSSRFEQRLTLDLSDIVHGTPIDLL